MSKEKKKGILRPFFMVLSVFLGLMCITYGMHVQAQHYGTAFFVIWILLGVMSFGLCVAIHFRLWSKLPKWFKIPVCAVLFVGIGLFVWVEALIYSQVDAEGEKDLDYIIVLGALVYEDGPSSILRARLNAAIEYMNDSPDTKCIVSGGQGDNEPFSEAEGMKRYLVSNGIKESRIIMEDQSVNTVQNIVNSKKLIESEDAKVGIVTSNFHVYRAVKIAKKQGIEDACGIAGYVVPAFMPTNMFREFFGVVKDTLKGNM